MEDFASLPGYKLLMSHHPEYYARYLRPYDIDLIVSGHAHGGQWRIFGRGVYAPDQGLFPAYTSGLHEGRLIISRGVANSVPLVPRFFNPCEVVTVTVESEKK
jgi:predicted MPP superfamily phosphohydrolase